MSRRLITTSGDETVILSEHSLVVSFPGRRSVVSTSWLNGGYQDDLTAVFNHHIPTEACIESQQEGWNVKTYMRGVARSLGLNPDTVTGLITSADMENAACSSESYRDLRVDVIVTGGIEINGGRAGDPASYYEDDEHFEPIGGTINTILIVHAALEEYTMVRALVTATEAKAVALQQVMARSNYSTGVATGSGTDMITIVADPEAPLRLSDAGKHSKLGELIGKGVIHATQTALERQTGLSPVSQRNVLARLARFSVTEDDLWVCALDLMNTSRSTGLSKEVFITRLKMLAQDPSLVVLVAALLHIIDETAWGLLPEAEACEMAGSMVKQTVGVITWIDKRSDTVQESILLYLKMAVCAWVLQDISGVNTPLETEQRDEVKQRS